MKKLFTFLFACSSCFSLSAQNPDSLNPRDKKIESKIAFLEYKYISGEYDEAVQTAKSLTARLERKATTRTPYIVKAKIIQASSLYASLRFDKAIKAYNEAVELSEKETNDDSKFLCYLLLSDYLQKTEDLISSVQYLKKAESLLTPGSARKKRFDLSLLKAKILFKQGFIFEPLKLIEEQASYRLEMASALATAEEHSEAIDTKMDFTLRKEKYAQLINLKAGILITKGAYNEADALIQNNKQWISTNLGRNHILYEEMLERQAEMSLLKKNYSEAASFYTSAYTCTPFPEYEQQKIKYLSKIIITCNLAGQTVKYKNYLRRLEMYAFRKMGFVEPFQLAFEYTESYNSFIEGNFTAAASRLNHLAESFNSLPASHPWNTSIIELKAAIALKSGDIKAYKQAIVRLAEIKQKYYGEDGPAYHRTQLTLALYEIHYGKNFVAAEKIMKNSYASVLKKEIAKESNENILYLSSYAELFGKTDRYDSAMVKTKEATEITKNIYAEKSADYLLAFSEYVEYQILSGKYKEGFENLQKIYDLSQGNKSGDHEVLQSAYMIMAKLYNIKGEFDRSQNLLNKAMGLTLEGYEKQALAEAETSEQLASLYLLTGNYFKAEKGLLRSLELKESTLEKNSPLIIHTCQELARLNLVNGNYTACEQYLKKASEITVEVFGKQSLLYGECQLIYAEYYLAIGDYKKAENACKDADDIETKKLGKDNLKRAEILSKLALIRTKIPAYKSVDIEKLYTEAGDIIKKSLGADNPLYIHVIQKQAEFYISTDKSDKADLLLTEAEKFWISKLGSENRYVAEILLLRGDIAYSKNKYDQAEKNYSKAKNQYSHIFDENHPWYIQASGKLARVYYMEKHPEKSLEILEETIPKYLGYIDKYFPSLSFREKSKFWNNIKEEFDFYNFIALCIFKTEKPKLSANVYDNVISTKALLLSSNIKVREKIINSKDSVLIALYNDWVSEKEYLTNVLSLTKQQLSEQNIDTKFIESRIENLEKEMNKRSQLFMTEGKKQISSWKNIKNVLGENEYAVEVLRCRYFNKIFTDSIIYAALVINNKTGDYPEAAIFPDGKSMEKKYFKYFRNATVQKIKDEYSYNVYWKPIKSKIPDGATIYLSSDGVYNQMNVEMMLSSEGNYVIDQNQIVSVTNTKDLLKRTYALAEKKKSNKENKKQSASNYILCGNPDFYTKQGNIQNKSLAPLPGAEKELLDINNLLVSSGKSSLKYLNDDITEDTLKQLSNPKVFHIATHGYFKEGNSSDEDDFASNPLLNSGLVLFGGGDIINNPENNYVNFKDGILTAYEAMNLNFDNTDLVVLSACETGRGEVQAGEGVYGLQRAFLIAGADAVVMSLFKVNDEVTQKLMLSFYEKWLKTGDMRRSFVDAKKEIKKQYDAPIYWGVFVMIEGNPGTGIRQQQ
jgi:CHAT domain-containing protein